jgi:EAL domain-containing protein (putative c-di-GMP-specific phosphodiesterase class I)
MVKNAAPDGAGAHRSAPNQSVLSEPMDSQHEDELELLSTIIKVQSEIAAAGLDPADVVAVILRRTREMTGSSGTVVELLDADQMVFWAADGSAANQVGLRLDAHGSLSGLCMRTGEILKCDDSEIDERVDREACRRVGLRSMLVVPLQYRDEPIGVLRVLSRESDAYGQRDVHALELMSALIGASLGRAATYSDLVSRLTSRIEGPEPAPQVSTERIQEIIQDRDLSIVYQPIVRLTDRKVIGVEALARFSGDPVMTPDRWFGAAAVLGLGTELELTAIDVALEGLVETPPGLTIAVNVSPETAASKGLEGLLREVDARRIVLEITEHASVEHYEELCSALSQLRELGARVAIDDAGAGFASFRHILNLEPDVIKLDLSLTRAIDTRPRHQRLARSLVTFAADTAAEVLAEGIETSAELETLIDLGVSLGQGYYLGRPGPLSQLEAMDRDVASI